MESEGGPKGVLGAFMGFWGGYMGAWGGFMGVYGGFGDGVGQLVAKQPRLRGVLG